MSGEWMWQADRHRCDSGFPTLSAATATPGDLWRCECDRVFIVADSQRDGLYLTAAVEDPATGRWKAAR